MAVSKKGEQAITRRRPPARTPEARENQLIALAVDLAEKQLSEGTASSQVIAHYLKLGTVRERIEREILEGKRNLIKAQTKAIESAERNEELYKKALDAMRTYSGRRGVEEDDY